MVLVTHAVCDWDLAGRPRRRAQRGPARNSRRVNAQVPLTLLDDSQGENYEVNVFSAQTLMLPLLTL